MATFKHISSKNADYGAAEQYLTFEHDEFTMKPTLDENGRLMLREDYRIATLNCGDEDFAVACMRSNLRYGKNQKREDVKSHHYIISFDPRDAVDNGLTVDRAQALGEEFCRKQFSGHQAIVCTHPDGHNHSGNIHVHIVINSLRIAEVPFLPYMDRPADTRAGCKHRCTDAAMEYFKAEVMEMCHRENLYQIDLLHGSKNRITEREYWAQKKGQAKSARAEKRGGEDQKSSRLKFSESEGGTAENAAEPSLKKKQRQPPPTAAGGESKTVGAKFYQKKQYKDAYAAAKRGQKAGTAASKQAAAATNTITEKAKAAVQEIVVQHKTLWVGIGVGILLVMVMLGAFSSCGAAIQGTGSTFVGTTYPSKDADMKGAEEDYLELEKELDKQIRQMESTHPGYDEYRYQLDEIGHDPYQLISHLTAVYEQFTRGQVKPVIKELFKQQYLLKVWETIEIRTRMETRVGVRPTIDAFGNVSMETYAGCLRWAVRRGWQHRTQEGRKEAPEAV